jgi:hypothetical protein
MKKGRLIVQRALAGLCLTLLGPLWLGGCVSAVNVVKASGNTPGLRYVLPEVFIRVTPRNDGGVDVEPVYLPDPDNEYAVQATSVLGNYTLEMNQTEEGFLTTVSFNADSSGVAKQLIDSAGNVYAAKVAADAEKEQKQLERTQAASEAAAKATEDAKKALSEAETALKVAQARLTSLEELEKAGRTGLEDQILQAQLTVAEARVRRDDALAALESKAANAHIKTLNQGNHLVAAKPVFFRVAMTAGSVQLVRAFPKPEEDLQTWRLPKPAADLAELEVLFAQGSSSLVRPDERGAYRFTLGSNRILKDVGNARLSSTDHDINNEVVVASLIEGGTTIVVDLLNVLLGSYTLTVDVSLKAPMPAETETRAIPITFYIAPAANNTENR